ncbi:hypothetical protein C7M61_000929 [Candidozyma pseudohaemuli]|uniref:Uncharacterized protein n=1 Tax=Candidozyma pseudohaemuli TaxID=418784 RepID=A0A2P7YZ68_9ASCO|nr:hypothetical protein C7M61_000929 [[Candida] pseudohaemulonii]PSK41253.1 hypothetical protein C7M61_000929 [[Candida] pseudohaemulonii]
MNINLEEALDEFDLRYLESYHQVTAKMALLGLGPAPELPLRLLLPLLPSQNDNYMFHAGSILATPAKPHPLAQSALGPMAKSGQLANSTHNSSAAGHEIEELNIAFDEEPSSLQKDHNEQADPRPELAHRALAPECQWLAVEMAGRLFVVVDTPRTLQRLLLALSLVHKALRRPQNRRTPTNVGNPFYKSKSPRRRRGLFDDAFERYKMEC